MLLAFAVGLWDFHGMLAAFAWGGLSHVLADAFTVMGIPFAPHSGRRFHLFGGRLRTWGAGEYGIAWDIVAVCLLVACCSNRMAAAAGIRSSTTGRGCISQGLLMRKRGRTIR